METIVDQIEKTSFVFDYIAEKTDSKTALRLCERFGFDNPHILIKHSLEECKSMVDKILILRGGRKIK